MKDTKRASKPATAARRTGMVDTTRVVGPQSARGLALEERARQGKLKTKKQPKSR